MKIVALKERAKGEYRVAITPETAKLFCVKGYDVFVEKTLLTSETDNVFLILCISIGL